MQEEKEIDGKKIFLQFEKKLLNTNQTPAINRAWHA